MSTYLDSKDGESTVWSAVCHTLFVMAVPLVPSAADSGIFWTTVQWSDLDELSSSFVSPPPASTVSLTCHDSRSRSSLRPKPKAASRSPRHDRRLQGQGLARIATSSWRTTMKMTSTLAVERETAPDYMSGRVGERRRVISCFTGCVSDFPVRLRVF